MLHKSLDKILGFAASRADKDPLSGMDTAEYLVHGSKCFRMSFFHSILFSKKGSDVSRRQIETAERILHALLVT